MSDLNDICLACGLCCDGTLLGFVQLESEEVPVMKELMQVENANGDGVFIQPCSKYCDGCTIYSKRPKQCASFKCGLLKSFEKKELDFDMAIELINEVKQRKIVVEKKLALQEFKLQSHSFYFKMVELNRLHKSMSSPSTQNYLDLISELKQLDEILSEKFDLSLS